MRTVCFDMMGLIASYQGGYPNFQQEILTPLQQQGQTRFVFWTRDYRRDYEHIIKEFRRDGLDCTYLGKEDVDELGQAIEKQNQAPMSVVENRIGLPEGSLRLTEVTSKWQEWQEHEGVYQERSGRWKVFCCKSPYLLGEDRGVVVESDLGNFDPTIGKIVRCNLNDLYIKSAKSLGISLILVPEYPDVWKENHCPVTPQAVLARLRSRLINLPQAPFYDEIGVDLGIYGEAGSSNPERS